jgi:hypothetical protein
MIFTEIYDNISVISLNDTYCELVFSKKETIKSFLYRSGDPIKNSIVGQITPGGLKKIKSLEYKFRIPPCDFNSFDYTRPFDSMRPLIDLNYEDTEEYNNDYQLSLCHYLGISAENRLEDIIKALKMDEFRRALWIAARK